MPLEPPTFLFFGTLRRNKGISVLLDAIAATADRDVRFHIAGRGFDDIEALVRMAAERDPRITAELTWISPARKSELFSQASVVVMPYTDFNSESGVLHDAYGHYRPVVVTAVGGLATSVGEEGTGWVVPPSDADALADAMGQALGDRDAHRRATEAAGRVAWERRPEVIGARLREVYDRAIARP